MRSPRVTTKTQGVNTPCKSLKTSIKTNRVEHPLTTINHTTPVPKTIFRILRILSLVRVGRGFFLNRLSFTVITTPTFWNKIRVPNGVTEGESSELDVQTT